MKKLKAINIILDELDNIKNIASEINEIAEKYNLFPDMPSKILDISCMCDELIGELDDELIN